MGESSHEKFGSALVNFLAKGSVAPPPPENAAVRDWQKCSAMLEFQCCVQNMSARAQRGSSNALTNTLSMNSNSMSAVAMLNHRQNNAMHFPFVSDNSDFPCEGKVELPGWWKRAIEPWDSALAAVFAAGGSLSTIPCMFHGSLAAPSGFGCAAPPGLYAYKSNQPSCCLLHDDAWLDRCRTFRRTKPVAMWLCSGCATYAGDSPCPTCPANLPEFLCGACPLTVGHLQCGTCETSKKPLPENIKLEVLSGARAGTSTGDTCAQSAVTHFKPT